MSDDFNMRLVQAHWEEYEKLRAERDAAIKRAEKAEAAQQAAEADAAALREGLMGLSNELSDGAECVAEGPVDLEWYQSLRQKVADVLSGTTARVFQERVETVRDALEEISDGVGCGSSSYGSGCDTACKGIARVALAKLDGKEG